MATASFDKQYFVSKQKANDFVEVIERPAKPTLPKSFVSKKESVYQNKELRGQLLTALGK